MQHRTCPNGLFPDVTWHNSAWRIVYERLGRSGLMQDGVLLHDGETLFPRCAGPTTIAKFGPDWCAYVSTGGPFISTAYVADGNWPMLATSDGWCVQTTNRSVIDHQGVVIEPAGWAYADGLAFYGSNEKPVRIADVRLQQPEMVNPQYAGNLVCGESLDGGTLVRNVITGNTLHLWFGQDRFTPKIAWDGAGHYCVVSSDMTTVFVAEFDESEVATPPTPDPTMRDVVGDLLLLQQGGGQVDVAYRLRPESGTIAAIRFLDNGDISQPADNALIHRYALGAGTHTLSVRGVGKNGKSIPSNSFAVVVDEPQPQPTFALGLVAGFGEPLPDERLSGFVRDGVRVVRSWIGSPANTPAVLGQLAKFPALTPLFIIRAGTDDVLRVPDGSTVEMGNEPNIGDGPAGLPKMSPAQYAAWATSQHQRVSDKRLTAYWGCPSNCSSDGLSWLKDVLRLCPWIGMVSVHRYNYGTLPNVEASPWGSRAEEMARVKFAIGARRFRVTEIGCMCGPRAYKNSTGFLGKDKKWMPYSEAQQLAYLRAEVAKWKAIPACAGCDIYQENSGVESDYGLNSLAGTRRQAWAIFG